MVYYQFLVQNKLYIDFQEGQANSLVWIILKLLPRDIKMNTNIINKQKHHSQPFLSLSGPCFWYQTQEDSWKY